jgi:lysophospholipase L1-like esterase
MKGKCRSFCFSVVLVLFFGPVGVALGYSSITSLGDSLSDNGNVNRFTDGPLWVELLADHYAVPLVDIAYGGATTGYDNPAIRSSFTGLQWQVEQLSSLPADSLITVWAGANDLLQSRSPFDAVSNIDVALENLYLAGGRDFVVPNLPDIGKVPSVVIDSTASSEASLWALAFNTSIATMLQGFNSSHNDLNLYPIDVFTIFNKYPVGSPEWRALFMGDGFHPSSLGHQMVYDKAVAAIDPVPEPATMLLFGTGIIGLIGSMVSRKKWTQFFCR